MPGAGIVILTARVSLNDRLAGYEMGGADIYLTKPTRAEELLAVVQNLWRRSQFCAPAVALPAMEEAKEMEDEGRVEEKEREEGKEGEVKVKEA